MKKTVSKRITALLLSLILAFGILATPVSAAKTVKGVMKEVAIDKLVETGMRVAAEACEALGEATGTETGEEIFSFIADWVFSSGSEAAANKAKELCEEILEQIKELEIEINNDFSVVESQISQEAVNSAKTNLQNKWKSDVDSVIYNNNATASFESYKKYLEDSITYNTLINSEEPYSESNIPDVDKDLEELLDAFYKMHLLIGGESSGSSGKEYAMFYSEKMNATFENMITLLATNLDAVESGSVEEYAVQYACNAFQFSHQQYSFVHNYVEKQILQLILVEMMYNEYLYQQGAFIENYESEGKASQAYQVYIDYQSSYNTIMAETVKDHITNMLSREVIADSTQKFSLDSYMKPEDAASDNLTINGYRSSYYSTQGTTYRKYIMSDTVRFNRVMTQTGNKNKVYYILDPSQFSDSNATKALAMDTKIEASGTFDTHIPSCDYLNLTTKSMSDGVNTFACTADIFGLFDTKAFRWLDSKPSTYLKGYLPSGTILFMTPQYEYGSTQLFDTTYEKFWVIEGDTAVSGSDVVTTEYSASDFQSDHGGDIYSYSVVLANNSDEYKQKATFKIPGHLEASVTDSDGNKIIDTTRGDASPSANITSGKRLTIKFKIDDGYSIESLSCIRNNSTSTETVLFDSDDIDILKTDGEYYTFSYPMPYSNTTFEFKVVSDKKEYDIWTPEDLINFSYDMSNGVNSDTTANLCADIDMTGYEGKLSPAGNSTHPFKGVFNGNNHKIVGLKFEDFDYCGLFGYIENATIKDVTISGDFSITDSVKIKQAGGAVGYANGGSLTNITSYVTISNKDINLLFSNVGGIVGSVGANKTIVEKCMFGGTLSITDCGPNVGGIVGSAEEGAVIKSCANVGTINTAKSIAFAGGILGLQKGKTVTIENCYNYSKLGGSQDEDPDSTFGAIIGYIDEEDVSDNISDNYYLDTSCDKVIGDSFGDISNPDSSATKKSEAQFASGEVAYLLNHEVTNGTQVWYQNIDNGKTPDDYPVFDGGTVYFGYVCDSESKIYSNYELSDDPSGHKFNDNGFCIICDQYQPATQGSSGVYEISNAGNFFWFASLVNNDSTHADFDKQDAGAKAVLVKDIDLESREWSPIRDYTGFFDGQNHTISNLKITKTPHYTGLFSSVYGTIKNFTVKGEMIISADGDHIGGVVGYADGSTISNITSYVNISNTDGVLHHIGGVVGYIANKDTFVDKCLYYGTVDIKNSTDCIGGIIGYTNAGARISNCANHGTVTTSEAGAYTGGILGYVNNSNPTIKDCYNYGKVSNGDSTQYCGAIIGWARNYTSDNISNNYYLDTSSSLAFGSGGKSGATATVKTAEQFKSGEVTYLLNHKIADESAVWRQNIDNDKTPDDYPVFEGGTVYYLEYKDSYSNFYSEKDEFEKDEDGNFLIKTYDDLVTLSNVVRSDYEKYGSANYILENNIKAPEDSKWTQGIGYVSKYKPFNGTFDGNGYCIFGLNVDSPKYGGLFEVIGEKGKVKDLFVFDCDFLSSSEAAGGIAAVNKGKIDHCTSGVNITSGYIHKNGKDIYAPELNSSISGERSGGIAGENSGSTIGCRSSAVVSGTTCGGITGVNTGKIYGCANNGKVGTSTSSVSGGLAGKNCDTIESSYNSGNVYGYVIGLIAGKNGFGDTTPTVTDVFYISQGGLTAFGTTPWDTSYDTIIEKTSDVKNDDSFANELNSVTDTSIVKWKQNSPLHKGYPIIEGNFYIDVVKSAGNNITVQGSMHKDLNIKYDVCSENSEEYKLLSSAKGNNKILNTYSVSLTDKDSNYIPAELWCSGSYKISVPVDSKNIQLAGIDTDGNIVFCKPDSHENGTAVFTVSYPMSFAIVETTAENPSSDNKNSTANNNTTNNGTPIQTGSEMCGVILLAALLSLTVILITKRRNKIG
ncbi:MAG: hypothetical protein ACI4I4_00585 [Acutalibacteraceae bacterium]